VKPLRKIASDAVRFFSKTMRSGNGRLEWIGGIVRATAIHMGISPPTAYGAVGGANWKYVK